MADVVAFEQAYLLNRFGAYVPGGMMFALASDVVPIEGGVKAPGNVRLRPDKRPRPIVLRANEGDCLEVRFTNLLSPSQEDEGGIPAENGGRLPDHVVAPAGSAPNDRLARPAKVSVDAPRTRAASFHVTGLELVPIPPGQCPVNAACGGDGSNVGLPSLQGLRFNPETSAAVKARFDIGSLAHPGQTIVTRWRAEREGAYFAHSMGAPIGGEGDGGQVGLGLFGSVNVEPKGARWYRSQVTYEELQAARRTTPGDRHPYSAVDYDRERTVDGRSKPILGMLDRENRIVSTDLNAVVVLDERHPGEPESPQCTGAAFGTSCNRAFREFTVIFHDEVHAEQAFAELDDENNPLHSLRDGMGINYGVSSMGSLVMSTPTLHPTGPAKNCPECRAEEFFLSSWANGDPALILAYNDTDKPVGARYPDDPSNVHHSYLGDPVRFRNLHAGPKETHVFHLHAHQWMQDASNPDSSYLDSQTISPGATFSYGIEFGGSGNRNYTPADSIFHCHLYPHFAQGMWELWRVHDAFDDGKPGLFDAKKPIGPNNDPGMMNLPDAEVIEGIASPAIVPIPGVALAPMPTKAFRGYPFYIPGEPGHRPPQPALDMDVLTPPSDLSTEPPADQIVNGGLPRHVVTGGTLAKTKEVYDRAVQEGGKAAQVIAQRVAKQDPYAIEALAAEWDTLQIRPVPHSGTADEKNAMKFHEAALNEPGLQPVPVPPPVEPHPRWWTPETAYKTDWAATTPLQKARTASPLFFVNDRPRAPGAPYANPCPKNIPERGYKAAFIQTELTYNKHGWFDPQGRIVILEDDIKDVIDPNTRSRLPEPLFFRANSGECINFKSSNFIPKALNADDFQIYTPTDTIGQHIHLVKFDVTSSDGSANGFNYEDATFSPEEVRERIFAYNRSTHEPGQPAKLTPQPHPLFRPGGDIFEAAGGNIHDPRYGAILNKGLCPAQDAGETDLAYEHRLTREHPLCGAQRTTQRWWADPIVNPVSGKDNTLRTVFTHDHLGPSSHQQHGLYAGLVIEPANSIWTPLDQKVAAADWQSVPANGILACAGEPGTPGRSPLCDKLIGGSNLAAKSAPEVRRPGNLLEGMIEPRVPLRLRGDGGPTATKANIVAPACIGNSDSNPAQPASGLNRLPAPPRDGDGLVSCPPDKYTHDTRREFALAIADFGIAYNTALEPINPEPLGDSMLRDNTALRFGRRHVVTAPARPLGISGEDPGSQYFNYRHEPLALRLSESTPTPDIGGWDYRQTTARATPGAPCRPGDTDCLGDPANGFSTSVHARRDEQLATESLPTPPVVPATRALLQGTPAGDMVDDVLKDVEQWRHSFNCALYAKALVSTGCPDHLVRLEPWRVFGDPATPLLPAFEGDPVQIRLIQGAQEAQHIFTMNGVKWHRLPESNGELTNNNSGYVNAQPVGISEHFEFDVTANPIDMKHADYLYFGSSVDQMWDGLWGVLRSYTPPAVQAAGPSDPAPAEQVAPLASLDTRRQVPRLPNGDPAPYNIDRSNLCPPAKPGEEAHFRFFGVSAVRVCDLHGDCQGASPTGVAYNARLGITDPKALAYVLDEAPLDCDDSATCKNKLVTWSQRPNATALTTLRGQFAAGRKLTPLVMRAAAGQCLYVGLRNLLPPVLDDGPPSGPDGKPGEVSDARAYHNFLPMITDGFNVNQFRMSSTVGLSAPRVAQNPAFADGSNVGLNSIAASGHAAAGSLAPPCTGDRAHDKPGEFTCRSLMAWSLTDYTFASDGENRPVEFGALPLRSFGDPLKHPMHGLVGALVVGPPGSRPCNKDRFAQSWRNPATGETEGPNFASGISAEICDAQGKPLYVDHVLVMQDAVNASRGGMPLPNLAGAEEPDDYGAKAINYATEPLWARTGNDPTIGFSERNGMDQSAMLSSALIADAAGFRCTSGLPPVLALQQPCDPETPVMTARPGETVRLEIVHPGGHTRQQGLALSGHSWNPHPWSTNSRRFDAGEGSSARQGVFNSFGPMMGVSVQVQAGGTAKQPMDYLFRSQASFLFDGGLWGILRVQDDPKASGG